MKRLACALVLSLLVHAIFATVARSHAASFDGSTSTGIVRVTQIAFRKRVVTQHPFSRATVPSNPSRTSRPIAAPVRDSTPVLPIHIARARVLTPRVARRDSGAARTFREPLKMDFSDTVARLRMQAPQDTPLRASTSRVASASRASAAQREGSGVLIPMRTWRDGEYRYYRVRYVVRYADGSTESGEVPWPLRYTAGADPFASGRPTHMDLPPPPPDYTLAENAAPLVAYCYAHRSELAVCPIAHAP